jgi:hypothetical protein
LPAEGTKAINQIDKRIGGILLFIVAGIVLYWISTGLITLWDWLVSLGPYQASWWVSLGKFLWRNFGIVFIIYVIICLQVSGIVEFLFRKNFIKAFLLAIVLTPPVMMVVYGHKSGNF